MNTKSSTHHDLHESSSDAQIKLLHDKNNPSDSSSFDQKEDSSVIHQRIFTSQEKEASNPPKNVQGSHQDQIQSQIEELSPYFGMFYKAVMMISILMSTGALLFLLFPLTLEFKLTAVEKFYFMVQCKVLWQSACAYRGFSKKDLLEIEKAFGLIKKFFLVFGLFLLCKLIFALIENVGKETTLDLGFLRDGALVIVLHTFLIFLPTRKVRNTLRSTGSQEEAQEHGSSEILNWTEFILYKYGLFLAVLLSAKYLLVGIFEDYSEGNLEKMMSEWSFFVFKIKGYLSGLLCMILSFLTFEGIRRRSLKKIGISIRLMQVYLAVEFILSLLEEVGLNDKGQIMWKHQRPSLSFINDHLNHVFYFISDRISHALHFLLLFCFGALMAQKILRAHPKLRQPE